MFFKQLPTKEASLSYLFGCGSLGVAVAVDVVAGDEDWYEEQAKAQGVTITHVFETHVHADHYSGGRALAKRMGAKYCLHSNAQAEFEFDTLNDGDEIKVGNVTVRVLHTPGHTMDSISLAVSDDRRSKDPWFIITGDTLFVGSIGRPDLAGREKEMAGMLFDSLHSKLLTYPDMTEIYPAHQAGSVCGAGISGKPVSTLGFEKKFNPMLGVTDKDEFIDLLTKEIPPRPAQMDKIVAENIKA